MKPEVGSQESESEALNLIVIYFTKVLIKSNKKSALESRTLFFFNGFYYFLAGLTIKVRTVPINTATPAIVNAIGKLPMSPIFPPSMGPKIPPTP